MSEEKRNRYLSIMGVARYVPRRTDTAAAEEIGPSQPRDNDSPENLSPPLPEKSASTRQQTECAVVEPLQARRSGNDANAERPSPHAGGDSEIHIRLAFWQPSEEMMIFDSLRPGQRPDRERLDLLANILKAIDRPLENPTQYELLDWPLARHQPGDARGARVMLAAFLKARLQQYNSQWILLMGRCASSYILPEDIGRYDDLLGRQLSLGGNVRAIVVPGLTEMLGDRACKAQTWLALKFLSGRA